MKEKCITFSLYSFSHRVVQKLIVASFLLVCSLSVTAQTGVKVAGVVTSSSDGLPLIGVSVIQKGTTNGLITDFDGNYELTVPVGADLEFSYIGYISQTVRMVSGKTTYDIVMREDALSLDEVVVVGYGVQKKKLSTGATLQVKGDELAKLNTTNPLQALQGKTPGVSITSTSGQPGSNMKVTIRGLGTVGNSGPLYLIDGIGGSISTLNPADIESIDILKDAASAAIYGAQAANGVVLITTKSGKEGKSQVSFDAYYGIQNVARKAKMLDANQYMTIMDEQALNSGNPLYDWQNINSIWNWTRGESGNETRGGIIDTDWVGSMFKDDAVTQSYNLGVSGGSSTSTYSMSLGYVSQEGVVGGKDVSNYERYNFRINSEHKLYNNALKVGEHVSFIYRNNTGISVGDQYNNTLRGAFGTSPLSPIYSDNGYVNQEGIKSPYNDTSNSDWYNADSNPYGSMMTSVNNINSTQSFVADVYAEIEPIKNLKVRSVFGINYSSSDYRSYNPLYKFSIYTYNTSYTSVSQNMSKGHTLTWTNTATYDWNIGDNAFNVLAGMESSRYEGDYLSGRNGYLKSMFNDWEHAYIDNTEGLTPDQGMSTGGRPNDETRTVSYFTRLGWNLRETYMVNATLRADGSSRFARGNRWGYFPSVSAGWVMTNEAFMENIQDWMDFFKIRVSWGQVGNQNISNYQYLAPIRTNNTNYMFGSTGTLYAPGAAGHIWGAYPNRLANPNVKWETSEQTNLGIDARFLKSRLGVNFDFYIKETKDWLVTAPILAIAGADAPVINGGSVKNTGVELAFVWHDNIGDLNYNIGLNGAYNKNKVGAIPNQDGIIHGRTNMLYDNAKEFYRAENGHSIGYFWGYKTAGIFQNQAEIDAWRAEGKGILQANVTPGDVKYVDQDKNGVIDDNDKVDLGNGMADVTFGFNLGFEYKGLDLSITANGMAGNKIVQSYRNHGGSKLANYTTGALSRWTGEGTSNRMPRVTDTNINWEFSDLMVHDGDFLRISNITLGYDFARLMKIKYISQARFYAQVQNAFTFTKYDGMDPEIGYGTSDWASGIDLGYYPRPRTVLFGVNLKF
jgi:TonB-linked outer membrane protein, SusC/RagA family